MAVLAKRSSIMTTVEAEAVLRVAYGLRADATVLRSERDQNFLMTAQDGSCLVLKLGNGVQDQRLPVFQTRALRHIATVDPGLPVPRIVPTGKGEGHFTWVDAEGLARVGYVVSFLPGTSLAGQPLVPDVAAGAGRLAARLGRALRGFFDPAAGHDLLWDFKHAARLEDLLPFIVRTGDRTIVEAAIARFRTHVEPHLPGLRAQVIHNDLNPSNLLVDPARPDSLVGIIDFGDMVFGALVGDVAVATSYLLKPGPDPFILVNRFVEAYHALTPLDADEVALLPDLIGTRHAMTCAITAWRAGLYPDNASYILRNLAAAMVGLTALEGSGRETLARRLRDICGLRG